MNQNRILTFLTIFFLAIFGKTATASDSLRLAQAYVNLSLTIEYFDSIDSERVSRILSFEENELKSIQDPELPGNNEQLLDFSYSLWNYAKAKHLSRENQNPDRKALLVWKKTLNESVDYFYQADSKWPDDDNPFFKFINFNHIAHANQELQIKGLKDEFARSFNKDIYPDFKRIFFAAKNDGEYYFDSLNYYCSLYDIEIYFDILDLDDFDFPTYDDYPANYDLATALDLMSRYLQLDFIANGNYLQQIDTFWIYDDYYAFVSDLLPGKKDFRNNEQPDEFNKFTNTNDFIKKDKFFKTHLNKQVCKKLLKELQKRYPFKYVDPEHDSDADGVSDMFDDEEFYYFPTPAPFPTSKIAIKHYKPELENLKQVDDHIRNSFVDAGYEGRLHYYYLKEPGFAISTGIERINKDGSPASANNRWDLTTGDDRLSLYNVFKVMFFKTESDYRLIACIVSEKEIKTTTQHKDIFMMDLIKNSYSSLPDDLEFVALKDKTITVLLYHYTQNDVGKVPMLNRNTILTVYDHLNKTSSLSRLISD